MSGIEAAPDVILGHMGQPPAGGNQQPLQSADAETAMLQIVVAAHHEVLLAMAKAMGRGFAKVARAQCLEDAFAGTAEVILAVEALQKAVKEAADKLRPGLAEVMVRTGADTQHTEDLVFSTQKAVRGISIRDPDKVPEAYKETKTTIDKQAMAPRMRAGELIPGAILEPAGPDILVIRRRNK